MSTRCTTHFCHGEGPARISPPVAIIYRHTNGYPEGAGVDIHTFLDECAKLETVGKSGSGPRFNDPAYLAAKYVVFLADQFNRDYDADRTPFESRLDFLWVSVVMKDPGDIEYRYVVLCPASGQRPSVRCYEVNKDGDVWSEEEVEIPLPQQENV